MDNRTKIVDGIEKKIDKNVLSKNQEEEIDFDPKLKKISRV
jgi:hypothetical protein